MKKRFNIGLVVSNITDSFSNRVAKGAISAAERLDANLFIFPMKYLDVDYDNKELDAKYEYQYNALMYYAAQAQLDYLIVCTGTVAYISSDERKREFLHTFDGTPVLNVASDIEGFDYLIYDNRSGVSDAVNYLIREQGRKHICMMIGRFDNVECSQRYEAYRAALSDNGLRFEDRMIIESDISPFCVNEANRLLDLNPECDAVLCVNDDMAAVVYDILRSRGKIIGKDILLVGFDDMPFAAKMDPPLASVKADAYELGAHAVEKVVNTLNGQKDESCFHSTEFIPRGSFVPDALYLNKIENVFVGDAETIGENMVNFIYSGNAPAERYSAVKEFCTKLIGLFYDRVISKISGEKDYFEIQALSEIFFSKYFFNADTAPCVVSVMDGAYMWLINNAPPENYPTVNRLFKYFFFKISTLMISDKKLTMDKYGAHTHDSNLFIRDTLMFGENSLYSYSQMMNKFHCIGLRSSYLYLLNEPVVYRDHGEFNIGETVRFAAYQRSEQHFMVPETQRNLPPQQVFTNPLVCDEKRHTYIAADLYSLEYQYGLLLCEPESDEFFGDLELVVYQVSGAVKLIRMIAEQERMMEKLHIKNLALENMSEIDELTGIYNRRVFYNAAERFIGENKGRKFIVCYADMDNLKMVNDEYGHSEGDYSIKQLALGLADIFGEQGIVGRMGGDEYAACILSSEDGAVTVDSLRQKKLEFIERLNSTAKKPYRIGMSMGLYECVCENSYDFKMALDKADGDLYGEKAKRKKEI